MGSHLEVEEVFGVHWPLWIFLFRWISQLLLQYPLPEQTSLRKETDQPSTPTLTVHLKCDSIFLTILQGTYLRFLYLVLG